MTARTASAPARSRRSRRFDLATASPVPQLAGTGPVAVQDDPVETTSDTTYYDTTGYHLARAGVSLRRDTVGQEVTWHLERPAGDDTEQVRLVGAADDDVPPQLVAHVRGKVSPDALKPVAHLKVTRRAHRLADARGATIAVLADDSVNGQTVGATAHIEGWRELELEPAPQTPTAVLDTVRTALIGTGIRPAHWPSKFARLVAGRLPARTATLPKKATAGDVVLAAVRAQVDAIRTHDMGVRRDAPDSVHQLRVAIRRLRSILGGYRRVLDRDGTRPLREELTWAAGALSAARDTEVLRARLDDRLRELPSDAVVGDVRDDLAAHFEREANIARVAATDALDSGRYATLLAALDDFTADPPLTRRARRPAADELPTAVLRASRKLDAAVAALADTEEGSAHDTALHDVRKRAKQARYTAEVARPVAGKRLRRWRKHTEALQTTLGDYQDATAARDLLRHLGDLAVTDPARGFTYGALYGRELDRAATLHRRFTEQWRARPKRPA